MSRKIFISLICLFIFIAQLSFARQTWLTWNTRAGLPSNNLTCLAIYPGKIAVGSDKGIGIFIDGQTKWLNINDYSDMMNDLMVRSIDFDNYGNLWAATPAGIFCLELAKFPESPLKINHFGIENGLKTIDTEVLQIVGNKLYVGCFGGWIYKSNIFQKASGLNFQPIDSMGIGRDQANKIVSVGITAMAMDYPSVGIYSTKGKGLVRVDDGDNLVNSDDLFSDWVNDFWAFSNKGINSIIAVTQNKMSLIKNNHAVGSAQLPEKEVWITCLTTCPDEETDALTKIKPEDRNLAALLGKRVLYIGTKGKGLWKFEEGRWYSFNCQNSPLPSDNINKVYYLPGAKKMAVLTDAGLTLFGIEDEYQYDEFEFRGSPPTWAKTFWPFMSFWGPRVFGYPNNQSYPIAESISYKKMLRGKDLWISHDRGISRFVFPSSPLAGMMQMKYKFAGRYENPLNDPTKNLTIEDNSVSAEQATAQPGELTWHHYCRELPNDSPTVDLSKVRSSLNMEILTGPLNEAIILAENFESVTPAQIQAAVEAAREVLDYPPIVVIETPNGNFATDSTQLYSIESQNADCPAHSIPMARVDDFELDFGERLWAVFARSKLYVLDSSVNVALGAEDRWYEVASTQLPWYQNEEILCIRRIGADLYFGTKSCGAFILPGAHAVNPDDIRVESWHKVNEPENKDLVEPSVSVIDICIWKTVDGDRVALLHEKGLSVYDGSDLQKISVPERSFTCMATDRDNNLWVGSKAGLIKISPDYRVKQIHSASAGFLGDIITHIAAASENAKYPYIVAVSTARDEDNGDIVPTLYHPTSNPYRLRAKLADTSSGGISLFDGKTWELWKRPGVNCMLFDQKFLWFSNNVRIMRIFIPVDSRL